MVFNKLDGASAAFFTPNTDLNKSMAILVEAVRLGVTLPTSPQLEQRLGHTL